MGKCKICKKDSGEYNRCTDCKREWKRKRLKAYKIVEKDMGMRTNQNSEEFTRRLSQVELGEGNL